MSALRSVLVVGLLGVLGCSHAPAREPQSVPTVPASPAQSQRTRVDHSRVNLNSSFADAYGYSSAFAAAQYATPAYAQAFAQTCRQSSDCGHGDFSCRAREDGVRVCMGYGSRGESCWFDADCISATCASHDGRKTCR